MPVIVCLFRLTVRVLFTMLCLVLFYVPFNPTHGSDFHGVRAHMVTTEIWVLGGPDVIITILYHSTVC